MIKAEEKEKLIEYLINSYCTPLPVELKTLVFNNKLYKYTVCIKGSGDSSV